MEPHWCYLLNISKSRYTVLFDGAWGCWPFTPSFTSRCTRLGSFDMENQEPVDRIGIWGDGVVPEAGQSACFAIMPPWILQNDKYLVPKFWRVLPSKFLRTRICIICNWTNIYFVHMRDHSQIRLEGMGHTPRARSFAWRLFLTQYTQIHRWQPSAELHWDIHKPSVFNRFWNFCKNADDRPACLKP